MTDEEFDAELARWNALDRMTASALMSKHHGEQVTQFRSCWHCNAAHEHLKDQVFRCFNCGYLYVEGWPAAVIGARSRGETIGIEDATDWRVSVES